MANNLTLEMRIKSILEDQGLAGLATKLAKTEKEVDKLQRKLKGSGAAAKGFGKELVGLAAGFLSLQAIGNFVKNAVTGYAQIERGLENLQNRLKAMGQEGAWEPVKTGLIAMEDSGKAMLSETIPAFDKFLGFTGDAGAALDMVTVAANLAENGYGNVSENLDLLTSLMAGRSTQAMKTWGIAADESNNFGKDLAKVYQEAAEKGEQFAKNQSQASESMDLIKGTFASLSREVGEKLTPAFNLAAIAVKYIVKSFWALFEAGNFVFDAILRASLSTGAVLGNVFNFKRLFTEGPKAYTAAVSSSFEGLKLQLTAAWNDYVRKSNALWTEGDAKAVQTTAKNREKVFTALGRKQANEAGKAAEEAAQKELEAWRKRQQAQLDSEARLARARAEMAAEGSDERLQLELEALEKEKLAAQVKEGETVDALIAIDAEYLGKKQQLINNWWMKWLDDLKKILEEAERIQKEKDEGRLNASDALLQAQIDAAEEGSDLQQQLEEEQLRRNQERELAAAKSEEERADIKKRHEIESAKLKKQHDNEDKKRDQEKRERTLEQTAAVFGQLAATFPKIKAFAIAEAIINTWLGVTKILRDETVPYWLQPIAIAAQIASGMAQVQKIRSAKMARGGIVPGPLNTWLGEDAATAPEAVIPLGSLAGRAALARAIQTGLAQTATAGGVSAPAQVVNHHLEEHHHYHASVIRQERDMRQFNRKIRVNVRRDQARFVQ